MARAIVNIPTSGHIGDVKSAMLTLAQFQIINGTQWVLADGSSTVGTKYATTTGATTVPDLRGLILRGKNNGRADGNQNPDGDLALGAIQSDAMQGHFHTFQYDLKDVFATGTNANWPSNVQTDNTASPTSDNANSSSMVRSAATDGTNGTPRTAVETRMRNVTVNHFIKVN